MNGYSGAAISVGGPIFTMWLTPTEDELRARYNPELRKRSLENWTEKQQEFEDFVVRLKQYSKSDRPSWLHPGPYDEKRRARRLTRLFSLGGCERRRGETQASWLPRGQDTAKGSRCPP